MRFTAEQRFREASAEVITRTFASPGLFAAYPTGDRLAAPEVVAHRTDGDCVELHLRYRFIGDLSSAVRAVVDPTRLSWVEETTHDLATGSATFVLRPDNYTDRLRCSGSVRVVPDGAGCRRLVEGDLKVRVALMGGTVERTLVHDLQDHLIAEEGVVEAYLASIA